MSNLPYTKKSLGQHWLTDEPTLQNICDMAELNDTDTVLEIGPGIGTLTRKLAAQAGSVVAVEFDERFTHDLPNKLHAPNLSIVHADILKYDLTQLPTGYKVVANIPYYLTSNLLRVLSESSNPPQTIVLLVQKEVAERVAAKPGQMSLLSVSVQLYYQASLGEVVIAALFTPPPKVDSQILKLTKRSQKLFPGLSSQQFFRVVKAGFAARRKTLLNSLAGGLRLDKSVIEQILVEANLVPVMRPQELSLDDWQRLAKVVADSPTLNT